MPADWLRYVGLAIATAILIFLIVRCVRPMITGVIHFGGGIRMRRENNPKDFAICVWSQIVGTLLFFAVYAYFLYRNFFADLGWFVP